MNLKEFDALIKRRREVDNRQRYNFGIVASAVMNSAQGDPDRDAALPVDFVPDWAAEKDKHDLRKMSPQQQKYYMLNMFSKRKLG